MGQHNHVPIDEEDEETSSDEEISRPVEVGKSFLLSLGKEWKIQ